jgi:TonB family protein
MREAPSIPLFLWVSAALVMHAVGTGGAAGVKHVGEKQAAERAEIRAMVRGIRDELGVIELDFERNKEETEEEEEDEPSKSVLELFREVPLVAAMSEIDLLSKPDDAKLDAKTEEEKKKKEEAEKLAKAEPPKPEEPKEEEKPSVDKKKPAELVVLKDNRIKIRQVTEDDQPDNKEAPRLADKAAHVLEETQAKDRSTDQVAKDPSPGLNQRGPQNQEGNGERHRIAQAEDKAGDPKKAPGENNAQAKEASHQQPTPPAPGTAVKGGGAGQPGAPSPGGHQHNHAQPSQPVIGAPGGRGPSSPDLVTSDNPFSEEIPEAAPGGNGSSALPGVMRPSLPGVFVPFAPKSLGLGVKGGPGGALNLSWQGFVKAVGEEELEKQRAAIGQSIRSQRPGSNMDTTKFARWLPDIENYDPAVKLGNRTALNAAHSPFAAYLSTIHNAIHPVFAEEFLPSLNRLGKGNALNEELVTHVEIILSKDEGKVLRMGVTKNSGNTTFDAAALEAIDRRQPFGPAPAGIESADGNVYLHWEFHRDPVDACSTRNATPIQVKDPKPITSNLPKKKPKIKPIKPGTEGAEPKAPAEKPGPIRPTRSKPGAAK